MCSFDMAALSAEIQNCRKAFDELNISVLTQLLKNSNLRNDLTIETIVEDFRLYMDYFNMHFNANINGKGIFETTLEEHEKRCHRQLDILLHGVLGK